MAVKEDKDQEQEAAEQSAEDLTGRGRESAEEESEAADITAELKQAKAEAEKNLDTAMRLQAEMENLRRRTARDIEKAHKFALEGFARELLTVADSIDLGLGASDDSDSKTLKEGLELTRKQFLTVLEKFGIEIIDAEGLKFDPEQHEAMTTAVHDELEPNSVVEVIQKGYSLNGRLIRPARVVVSTRN